MDLCISLGDLSYSESGVCHSNLDTHGTFFVVQWLRLQPSTAGVQVLSLVGKLRSHIPCSVARTKQKLEHTTKGLVLHILQTTLMHGPTRKQGTKFHCPTDPLNSSFCTIMISLSELIFDCPIWPILQSTSKSLGK